MADFSALKQSIQNYIKQNGNKEITGNLLQNILLSMVTTMGDGAINDNASNISDIKGDIQELALGVVYDVSANNPTSGPNNDGKWESLSALLSDASLDTLIPTSIRKGGMSIKFVQSSDNKYVQYRLMANSFSTIVSDWQSPLKTVFSDSESVSIYDFLIKEIYITNENIDNSCIVKLTNVARNVDSQWYVEFKVTKKDVIIGNYNIWGRTEPSGLQEISNFGYLVLDWTSIPVGVQTQLDIILNDNIFDKSFSPFIQSLYDKIYTNKQIELSKSEYKTIAIWSAVNLPGYASTSGVDGTPLGTIGQKVTYSYDVPDFKHVRIPVNKGEIVYVPYISGNYNIKNPYLVDEYDVLLQIGDIRQVQESDKVYFEGDSQPYWAFIPESNGYLIMCRNSDFKVYSNISTVRQTKSPEESEPVIGTESLVPFDFEVARTMNQTMLKSIIESSSNGACTVIYDVNGYPNLMYKIPLTTIGALAPTLGDLETPHPAFMVGGVRKKHIYAAVFMNAEYNGVPVSWFGLGSIMRSKSFFQSRTLCAAKGTGWHLETIWERSLISLLSMKHHGTMPRGNDCWGRSRISGYEYECIERVDDNYPGQQSNGCQWYNGTQPDAWSHNNSRWGIFDIIGGYHEWCNLAKVVDGQIYLMSDNKYTAEESEWTATGVYIGLYNDQIAYNNEQFPLVTDITTRKWINAVCLSGYDNISENMRKKLALSLMCPRLSSQDTQAIYDFKGTIWTRRIEQSNYTTYPFLGGAEEYSDCGLGFNILSYDGNEAHNNMGSRLFYIE